MEDKYNTEDYPPEDKWVELLILSRHGQVSVKARRVGLNFFEPWDIRIKDKILGWREIS